MSELKNKKCTPCEDKNTKPLSSEAIFPLLHEVSEWKLSENQKTISREFEFKDFVRAIDFVRAVADIAEMEGHHPDIHIFYNKVQLELSTHSIGGLTENDFIVAAQIDAIPHF